MGGRRNLLPLCFEETLFNHPLITRKVRQSIRLHRELKPSFFFEQGAVNRGLNYFTEIYNDFFSDFEEKTDHCLSPDMDTAVFH